MSTLRGLYFVSKRGMKLFKVDPQGQHILIKDGFGGWGDSWYKYQGGKLPTTDKGALYYKRVILSRENFYDCGYDYAIVPYDWKYEISEEDL